MSVFMMSDKPRLKPWCCEIRDAGQPRRTRNYFKTEKQAKEHEARVKSRLRRAELGLPAGDPKILKRYKVKDIVRSFMAQKNILKGDALYENKTKLAELTSLPRNQFDVLWKFSEFDEFADVYLNEFTKNKAKQYRDVRLKGTYSAPGSEKEKTYAASTVHRDIVTIKAVWKWASENNPDLPHLENPWVGLSFEGYEIYEERERILEKGEVEKLIEACEECQGANKYYIPLAIQLTIDTGLRRQELIELTWEAIDFERRRITIAKSKTDKKHKQIVLPMLSKLLLEFLELSLATTGRLPKPSRELVAKRGAFPKGRIFLSKPKKRGPVKPMSSTALTQAFTKVVKKAALEDFTFKDLRRSANMNLFDDAGLTSEEKKIMMRHRDKNRDTNSFFYNNRNKHLSKIQTKLDKHLLGGMTLEEAELVAKKWRDDLFAEGLQSGLGDEEARERVEEIVRAERLKIGV